jgi:hypothetical protein
VPFEAIPWSLVSSVVPRQSVKVHFSPGIADNAEFSPTNSLMVPISPRTFAESNSETSAKLNDVFIVNLLYCKNIDVKKEQNGAENHNQEPQSINLQRVSISSSGLDLLTLIPATFLVKQQSPQLSRTEEAIGERPQGQRQRRSPKPLHVAREDVDIRAGLLEWTGHSRLQ